MIHAHIRDFSEIESKHSQEYRSLQSSSGPYQGFPHNQTVSPGPPKNVNYLTEVILNSLNLIIKFSGWVLIYTQSKHFD